MIPLISIDPGVNDTAIALWSDTGLCRVGLLPNDKSLRSSIRMAAKASGSTYVRHLVVENQWHGGKAPAKSVIDLAFWAGVATGCIAYERLTRIAPSEWKKRGGSTKKGLGSDERKAFFCRWLWFQLGDTEREIVETAFSLHSKKTAEHYIEIMGTGKVSGAGGKKLTDLLDAVGIGMHIRGDI